MSKRTKRNRRVRVPIRQTNRQEQPVVCPYCNNLAKCVDSKMIYRKSYGPIWICWDCHAYVGCHKGTKKPKGQLANEDTRRARIEAHAAFDPLWKSGRMRRNEAYYRLADLMQIPRKKCHIGEFTVEQCAKVIECVEQTNL